ncbi:MAG: hypothetical protein OHK0046_15130 [Anaerolineae bacterium]
MMDELTLTSISGDIDPPLRLLSAFQSAYPEHNPETIVLTPGRELWIAACTSDLFELHTPDLNGRTRFNWRDAKFKRTVLNRPLPRWSRYPAGVIYTLCADGLEVSGFKAVIMGAEAAGVRYEYGLGLAVAALLHTLHGREYTANSLVDIMERVRREYVEA